MNETMNSPNAIAKLIEESEAYQIHNRLFRLDTNLFVFDRNYQDLKSAITIFTEPERIHLLFDRSESDTILRHIIRVFHNYVASAKTLLEHTRLLIRDWYKNTDFLRDYNEQIKLRFLDNPLTTFIEDLRNYILHYSLPLCGLSINVTISEGTKDDTEEITFFIEKETLLEYSNWQKGRVFLQTAKERIVIRELADEYYKQILDFHNWMHIQLREIHSVELKWLLDMQNRIDELLPPIQGTTSSEEEGQT